MQSAVGIAVIAEAANGREALEQLHRLAARRPPRVVPIDAFMPEMDGISATANAETDEVAAAIRASARGEVYLDLAVTGPLTRQLTSPAAGLAALAARTHVSHVLTKPVLPSRTQAALLAIREGLISPPGEV